MWQIRRASVHCRNHGLNFGSTQIFCLKSEIARCYTEKHNPEAIEPQGKRSDEPVGTARFFNTFSSKQKPYVEIHSFSSQASAKSHQGQDDDSKDSFVLEKRPVPAQENVFGDDFDADSFSESEIFGENVVDDVQNELESSVTETVEGEKGSPATRAPSSMTKAILAASASSVGKIMDKWVEKGNVVTITEALSTMAHLRWHRMYVKALQMLEWMESKKYRDFVDKNYVSRVDLIAKVHGISAAEKYIKEMPESFRTEVVYRTLLANCVSRTYLKKSEEVFNKMKELFPITIFACNQLLLLYKRTETKKIENVLKLMARENIRLSVFSYQILINAQVQRIANDMSGVEQLIKRMKSEGIEPSSGVKASLARGYAARGLKDKAEVVLKEVEGDDLTKKRWLCQSLLPIYALLGREDEVKRIWAICESSPRTGEYPAAIEAWGQLNKIENAEGIFEKLTRPNAKDFTTLLNVYANHKMLDKGKELVRRMAACSIPIGPFTWHLLVKLHIGAGEVEKADAILDKAIKQRNGTPLFNSYLAVLDQYAERGAIHNAENILFRMREAGFSQLARPYQLVLTAYLNAKAPAYGFHQRLKGDNIVPFKSLTILLDRVGAFRKSHVEELLE